MAPSDPPQLSADTVRNAISKALPQARLDNETCQRLSEGTEHRVWSFGDYIFRALPQTGRPKGRSEASIQRDKKVTDLLKQHVPDPDCIPNIIIATISVESWIGNVETKLEGQSSQTTQSTQKTEDDLVEFLNALATIPIEHAMAATQYEEPKPDLRARLTKAERAWQDVLVPSGLARATRTIV